MQTFPTYMVVITGAEAAVTIATNFIRASRWVAVIPLPDDRFGVEVRPENQALLNSEVEKYLPTSGDHE
jgi:hypothetical protein